MTQYLDLVDYLLISEAVTGIEAGVPDGNKRAAWVSLREFCARNGYQLTPDSVDDAVTTMEALAAHSIDEAQLAVWIQARLHPEG